MRSSVALLVCLTFYCFAADAKIIIVNSSDNEAATPGQTNLVQAINLLADGDTIQFNLSGPGPFYLITPPLSPDNGYPAITNNNITIDGYSQPGASPNSNPILSSNNARIEIVLDSRDGGAHVEDIPGYSAHESAALMIKGATNVTIRGLCFLGPGIDSQGTETYAISFALGADSGHVSGCWIGVDLDGRSTYRFLDGVTGFEGPSGVRINNTVIGVEKNAPDAAAARAQFNIIVGQYIAIGLEGEGYRIAGNFFNVFPDGLTDYNVNGEDPYDMEAFIELGHSSDNLILGTDGDGHNDADERNIFGGVTMADDGQLLEWYGGARTNMTIAGNYFGVGVDGVTRFTNSMKVFGWGPNTTTVRIGSDFDGVSDDIEGNLISMNYPFETLFPSPGPPGPPLFADLSPGARVSLRGNRLMGNNIPPFSFADGSRDRLMQLTNYYAPYAMTSQIIPTLSTDSTTVDLKGSCDLGRAPYTNIVVDVYLADPEGWTNGQSFELQELEYTNSTTGDTAYYGFAQGRAYLGSFADNDPLDHNPGPGEFEFDLSSLHLAPGSFVTVAVNYSVDPPGMHNGRAHTSPFAMPITLSAPLLLSAAKSGSTLILSWPTNFGVMSIQSTPTLQPADWVPLSPQPALTTTNGDYCAAVPLSNGPAFFRLAP